MDGKITCRKCGGFYSLQKSNFSEVYGKYYCPICGAISLKTEETTFYCYSHKIECTPCIGECGPWCGGYSCSKCARKCKQTNNIPSCEVRK